MPARPEAYDEVPYPSHAFAQTHPDRLATLARLFGMIPAPVDRCRVLEIACGDGSNLIPMAFAFPSSRFVGVDAAGTAIDRGLEIIRALGLGNIELHHLDLMEVRPDFGQFDYIIAHGIYSWVPAAVRDRILSIAKCNLAPQGISYVSYNTFPGGHLRSMIREMALFHVRGIRSPEERVDQALALMQTLADAQPQDKPYGIFLRHELERILERRPEVLYHDELSSHYRPVWFHQFAAHARRHGLQYVAEANFTDMQAGEYLAAASQLIPQGSGIVEREQYLDFLRFRGFRQTLLCHADVELDRNIEPARIAALRAASRAHPVSADVDVASEKPEEFKGPHRSAATSAHPLVKAVLLCLCEAWPQSLAFDELLEAVGGKIVVAQPERAAREIREIVLRTFAAGLVELHTVSPALAATPGERPVASPLARYQLQTESVVTSLRHTRVELDGPLERRLLLLLDGTRDRGALLAELRESADSEGAEITPEALERNLHKLARLALLVR